MKTFYLICSLCLLECCGRCAGKFGLLGALIHLYKLPIKDCLVLGISKKSLKVFEIALSSFNHNFKIKCMPKLLTPFHLIKHNFLQTIKNTRYAKNFQLLCIFVLIYQSFYEKSQFQKNSFCTLQINRSLTKRNFQKSPAFL